jgi:hypothetical protein
MDLSDDDLERIAEADRREVDPPIQVDAAAWSAGGTLDWWVKERQQWMGRVRARTVSSGGSERVIFVPRAAHNPHLALLFVVLCFDGRACKPCDAMQLAHLWGSNLRYCFVGG